VSRPAKPAELSAGQAKGVKLTAIEVSYDGLAVIVNEKNALAGLSLRQVEQFFTGAVTQWSAVGSSGVPFSIYTRNTASGTCLDFKDLAMKKRD